MKQTKGVLSTADVVGLAFSGRSFPLRRGEEAKMGERQLLVRAEWFRTGDGFTLRFKHCLCACLKIGNIHRRTAAG